MPLESEGELSLDDSIKRSLPETPGTRPTVTVRQLLTHTSLIPLSEDDVSDHAHASRSEAVRAASRAAADRPLPARSGSTFEHPDAGHTVLGAIVERASGTSFGASESLRDEGLAVLPERPTGSPQTGRSAAEGEPLRVTAGDVSTDLVSMLRTITDLHPNPFWSRTEADVRAEIDRVVLDAERRGGLTPQEWYRAVARLVVSLDDPHMWVFVPGWSEHVKRGGTFLPFRIEIRDGVATIAESADNLRDAQLLSINGVAMTDLIAEYRPLAGQLDDPYGDVFFSLYFPRYLWFFRGWEGPFDLVVRQATGERALVLEGATAESAARWTSSAGPALEYRDLEPGSGLLIFRQCIAAEQIHALAAPIFRSIQQRGVERLIVDVRDNSGGGDDAWIALLDYLTDTPFSGYSGSRYRVTQGLKDLLGERGVREKFGEAAWLADHGQEFSYKLQPGDLRKPGNPPEKYRGRWAVLAGRGTFSSGMSFVCAVKAYNLALVVGEETGGRVRGFGQWERVTFPRTNLQIAVSTKEFIGAVDVPYRRGVPPDVVVRSTRAVDPGDDAAISAALETLR
jgi:hypothetical protein